MVRKPTGYLVLRQDEDLKPFQILVNKSGEFIVFNTEFGESEPCTSVKDGIAIIKKSQSPEFFSALVASEWAHKWPHMRKTTIRRLGGIWVDEHNDRIDPTWIVKPDEVKEQRIQELKEQYLYHKDGIEHTLDELYEILNKMESLR